MQRFPRYRLICTAMLATTLLAISVGQRLGNRASGRRSLDNWDIGELVDHLNDAGLDVRLQSTRSDGVLDQSAYLTTGHKVWDDLNRLRKDPKPRRIQEWQGIVHCERLGRESEPVLPLLGTHYLVAGPFVFYGDADLLERIRAVLMPSVPPVAP